MNGREMGRVGKWEGEGREMINEEKLGGKGNGKGGEMGKKGNGKDEE